MCSCYLPPTLYIWYSTVRSLFSTMYKLRIFLDASNRAFSLSATEMQINVPMMMLSSHFISACTSTYQWQLIFATLAYSKGTTNLSIGWATVWSESDPLVVNLSVTGKYQHLPWSTWVSNQKCLSSPIPEIQMVCQHKIGVDQVTTRKELLHYDH